MKFGFKEKTFWELLKDIFIPLLSTVISVSLALYLLNKQLYESRNAELDKNRQSSFQNYLDKMTQLLLEKKIDLTKQNDGSFIAQAMTLNLLNNLDGVRKGQVIQFMHQTKLISFNDKIASTNNDKNKDNFSVVSLQGANLSDMDLQGKGNGNVDLQKSVFSRSNMRRANLSSDENAGSKDSIDFTEAVFDFVDLSEADLSRTIFRRAGFVQTNMKQANLERANLSGSCLQGANLTAVKNLNLAKLKDTKYVVSTDKKLNTLFPEGFNPEKMDMKKVDTCG
jgi:uncharacterized protein YjbI with pentapeptide repeats